MDVLDFGCGTGLLSPALRPDVHTITAVDRPQGMLDVLEAKIKAQGLKNVRTRHVDLEQATAHRDVRPRGQQHDLPPHPGHRHAPRPESRRPQGPQEGLPSPTSIQMRENSMTQRGRLPFRFRPAHDDEIVCGRRFCFGAEPDCRDPAKARGRRRGADVYGVFNDREKGK